MKKIFFTLILSILLFLPNVNAEEKTTAKFKIENIVVDDNTSNTTFSYEIKAEGDYPLPNEGLSLIAGEIKEITIDYEKEGLYTYNIEQITEETKEYKLDKSKYKVNIRVEKDQDGKLVNVVWIEKEGLKVEKITYENEKIKEEKSNPTTGDIDLTKYVLIIGISLLILLITIIMIIKSDKEVKSKKKKK